MKLLAIDPSTGKSSFNGWSFWDGKYSAKGAFQFTSYLDYRDTVLELIKKYRPQAVLYAEVHMYNVLRLHARLYGIIDMCCEDMEIQSIIVSETHAKKVVLGKGRVDKQEIMDHYEIDDSDIADSMLLIESYLKDIT